MPVNVDIDDNIFNRVKNEVNGDICSPSQVINQYLLEKLDDSEGANIVTSSFEIQKVLAHDNPDGNNPLKDLAGIIDRGVVTDAVELKHQTFK